MTPKPGFAQVQDEVWQRLRAHLGERWDGARVVVHAGPWMVLLDSFGTESKRGGYTRLSAPFANPETFRFTIYEEGPFSWLGKLLGMQDIEIGEPPFDEAWVVQSNSPPKVRTVLGNPQLQALLPSLPACELTLRDAEGDFDHLESSGDQEDQPPHDELLFSCAGLLDDPARLERMYQLFAITLIQLCSLSAAYE